MSNCKIILDNYNNAFYAGQTVTGRLDCFFQSEKKVKCIHIRLTGKASVRWTESESYYDSSSKKHRTRQVTYWSEQEYFSIQINLVTTAADHVMIPPGSHSYPFQYILPPNLPSSFEGDHYRIRYKVKATVDRPWKFDIESDVIYNIFAPIDLNYFPNCRNPVKVSDDKTVCCWCCASGPIELIVSLPKTGFAVGEKILVSCYVSNLSNVTVDQIEVKLKQHIEYTAHSPRTKTRDTSIELARANADGVGAHGEKTANIELQVPASHTVPNLIGCNIIKCYYKIKVEAVLPFGHTDLEVYIPIQLGHVAINTIGGPEPVTRAPAYVESSIPLKSASVDVDDFVIIDHVGPAAGPSMPMPVPPLGPPPVGPPPVGGMPMPIPQMPMPGYPPSEKQPGYPPSNIQPGHPGGFPSAPAPDMSQNPTAPPPLGGGFVMPGGTSFPAVPPSYDQAIATPEKKPL